MEPLTADWMFFDVPNTAVLTTRSIVHRRAGIMGVWHDADDGCWQFHDGSPGPPNERKAMVVSLRSMVLLDPTLNELADLPLGWRAWRDAPTAPWQRAPSR